MLDAALESFWASIECPYIDGDMDPVANAQLRAAAAEAVAAWIALNDTGADDDAELTRTGCGPDAEPAATLPKQAFCKRDYEAQNIVSSWLNPRLMKIGYSQLAIELNAMLRSPVQPLYIRARASDVPAIYRRGGCAINREGRRVESGSEGF